METTMPINDEKYLVTGAAGQLGCCLQNAWGGEEGNAIPRAKEAFDITNEEHVQEWLPRLNPDVVINCAGYTNVQQAEEDRHTCWRANVLGVANLAEVCSENDIALLHISSDFVFGQDYSKSTGTLRGHDPTKRREPTLAEKAAKLCYGVDAVPGPTGFYGYTKALSEQVIQQRALNNPDFQYYIVRTAGLYEKPWRRGRNFPYAIASRLLNQRVGEVDVVSDVTTNITYVPHLVKALKWLVENRNEITVEGVTVPVGTYHITNKGMTSWYRVAQALDQLLGFSGKLRETTQREYCAQNGQRLELSPAFTALCPDKYEETLGPKMPPWQAGIKEWAEEAVKHFRKG